MAGRFFVFCIPFVLAADIPCTSYADLPRAVYRGGKCANTVGKEVCDNTLTYQWYRARGLNNKDIEIQTTPAEFDTCGTKFPFWMNGSHPAEVDGEVTRKVCMTNINNQCASEMNIMVKNCSGYYVYKLRKTAGCPESYCFGANEPCPPYDPCDVFEYERLEFEPGRSAVCGGNFGTCDRFSENRWYKFETSTGYLNVSSGCPGVPDACGAPLSIWINDTVRLENGTDQHKACVKDVTSCCSSTRTVLSKQCTSFRVYNFGNQPTNPCQRVCTDNIVDPCPTIPTVPSTSTALMSSTEINTQTTTTDNSSAIQIRGMSILSIGLFIVSVDIFVP